MLGTLMPTKWYHPTGASDPMPCEWQGWVDFGRGPEWITVTLYSA